MRDRILDYMAQGLKAVQVASIVGCSASYISQLGKDEKFLEELKAKMGEFQAKPDEDKALTNKYMAIEHRILNAMDSQMELAELPALTRALEVIGNRQEKRALRLQAPVGPNHTVNIVNITLPSHAIPEYTLNSQKEVVSIGEKVIAPMNSAGVQALFQQRKQQAIEALATKVVETEF